MRRVLVTGANKGIGRAIAISLAKDGFEVNIQYTEDMEGAKITQSLIEKLGKKANILQFDLKSAYECKHILEQDIMVNGRFYGIVSNAREGRAVLLNSEVNNDTWYEMIQWDLNCLYNVLRPCIYSLMQTITGGRIIALPSVSVIENGRGHINYSGAKAGIISTVRALAMELAKRGITVNCVAPGFVETEMPNDFSDMAYRKIIKSIPLRKIGKDSDVAALVSFLFSENGSYITKQVIGINGGLG